MGNRRICAYKLHNWCMDSVQVHYIYLSLMFQLLDHYFQCQAGQRLSGVGCQLLDPQDREAAFGSWYLLLPPHQCAS